MLSLEEDQFHFDRINCLAGMIIDTEMMVNQIKEHYLNQDFLKSVVKVNISEDNDQLYIDIMSKPVKPVDFIYMPFTIKNNLSETDKIINDATDEWVKDSVAFPFGGTYGTTSNTEQKVAKTKEIIDRINNRFWPLVFYSEPKINYSNSGDFKFFLEKSLTSVKIPSNYFKGKEVDPLTYEPVDTAEDFSKIIGGRE